jgi:hypothetical protein
MELKEHCHHSLDNNLLQFNFTFFSTCVTVITDCNCINYVICLNRQEGIRMRKQIVCTLSFFIPLLSLQAADNQAALVMKVLAPKEYGEMNLNRYADRFSISVGDQEKQIPNYMVSKPLRQMKPEQLAAFLQTNYLTLNQCSDGEFSLREHGRIKGGGWLGTAIGAWTGRVVGYTVVYGGVAVVCAPLLLVPGAGGPAYGTAVAPVAEGLAMSLAIAGGITGGVATGPI